MRTIQKFWTMTRNDAPAQVDATVEISDAGSAVLHLEMGDWRVHFGGSPDEIEDLIARQSLAMKAARHNYEVLAQEVAADE